MLQKLQWDSLQQRRACNRVLMLYHICNGLVAIPASAELNSARAHTRGSKTRYRQIQCNTNTYSHTFFPTAICIWNTLPVDGCQLPPDSFKAQLNSVQLTKMPVGLVFILCTAPFLSVHCFHFTHLDCLKVIQYYSTCVGTYLEEEEEDFVSKNCR